MSNRKDIPNANKNNASSGNTVKIALGALLAVAVIVAIYFGFTSNRFQSETERLQSDLSELNETRNQLHEELTQLEGDYDDQISENEMLQAEIAERVAEVEDLKKRLSQVRAQLASSKSNSEKIKERLAQLEDLKMALETDIEDLKVQNTELMATNDLLHDDLEESRAAIEKLNVEVTALSESNSILSEKLFKVAPAGYRADNFSIVAEKRNDKLTSKAKQVDEVKIKFNLNNVPKERHGERELYIAVTDLRGEKVAVIPTKEVFVRSRDDRMKVQAVDIQKVNLKGSQSIAMSFKPTDDLEGGEYNLMVYSADGYLGSTGFVLR